MHREAGPEASQPLTSQPLECDPKVEAFTAVPALLTCSLHLDAFDCVSTVLALEAVGRIPLPVTFLRDQSNGLASGCEALLGFLSNRQGVSPPSTSEGGKIGKWVKESSPAHPNSPYLLCIRDNVWVTRPPPHSFGG